MPPSSMFKNRLDAGEKLAPLLVPYAGTNAIILAIPRGGVVVGQAIARILKLPLDIVVTRKIGAPGDEEYAIGAIDIDGIGTFNEKEVATVDKKSLTETIAREMKEAKRRFARYRGTRGPLELKGRTVIIVDDGIATGLTVKAAIQYVKKMGAEKVIVASPVASKDTAEELSHITETKILTVTPLFFAVGQCYKDFPQISDEEVISILSGTAPVAPSPASPTRGILIDRLTKRILQAIIYSNIMNNKYIWGIIILIIIAGIVWWSTMKEPAPPPFPETRMMTTEDSMVPRGTNDMGVPTIPETGMMTMENSMTSMGINATEMSTVIYTNDGFSPAGLTIKAGTTVTFTNQSSAPMWVASGAHPTHLLYPEFDAKASVPNGGSYSFTFNKIGEHPYHNHMLLGRYGKIIVE